MKPVDQTRFNDHPKGGNCLAACLASLLEMPIEGVPDFDMRNNQDDWRLFFGSWLNELGYALTCVYLSSDNRLDAPQALHGSVVHLGEELVILAGPGPRDVGHACVGKLGFVNEFDVVHDPHPSRAGLKQVVRFYMVTPKLETFVR